MFADGRAVKHEVPQSPDCVLHEIIVSSVSLNAMLSIKRQQRSIQHVHSGTLNAFPTTEKPWAIQCVALPPHHRLARCLREYVQFSSSANAKLASSPEHQHRPAPSSISHLSSKIPSLSNLLLASSNAQVCILSHHISNHPHKTKVSGKENSRSILLHHIQPHRHNPTATKPIPEQILPPFLLIFLAGANPP